MHPLYSRADVVSGEVLGAAIEVHREKGAGLIESIYERCLAHELALRELKTSRQERVQIKYKGLVFEETLRCDLIVDGCLLVEVKSVECLLPIHKAQLLSYMKLLDIPVGLLINFHQVVLRSGIARLMLAGANQP
jgi:GxxExxY protein